MIRSFSFTFKGPLAVVFDRLIHQSPLDDEVLSTHILRYELRFDNDTYCGFEMDYDLGEEIATLIYEVSHYEKEKEVRYIQKEARFENGETFAEREGFPYSSLNLRYLFTEIDNEVVVKSEYHFVSKGWISWIVCVLFIFPGVRKNAIQSYQRLQEAMSNSA